MFYQIFITLFYHRKVRFTFSSDPEEEHKLRINFTIYEGNENPSEAVDKQIQKTLSLEWK